MMERKVLLICFVAGFLGLLSAATGFGAEGTRIKVNKLKYSLYMDLFAFFFDGFLKKRRSFFLCCFLLYRLLPLVL